VFGKWPYLVFKIWPVCDLASWLISVQGLVQITLGLYSFVCGDIISIHAVDVVFQKSWTFVSGMHESRLVFNLLCLSMCLTSSSRHHVSYLCDI